MTTRIWVYLALLAFVVAGSAIDVVVWPGGPAGFTWNDFLQTIGIVVFVYWWESADAKELGEKQSTPARLLTIFVPPVGQAIYLFQTRPWPRASGILLGFWAGLIVAGMVGYLLAAVVLDIVDPIQVPQV